MPSILGRNLHLCFSKIKQPVAAESPPNPLINPDHNDHSRPLPTSLLLKNFNSLFDLTTTSKSLTHSSSSSSSSSSDLSSSSESDIDQTTTTPDFATAFASQRFFFSSPGRSNSIVESSLSPLSETLPESNTLVGGSIAIPTYSPDPYMDFRLSMQEMVEARELIDVRANWDYLHELLLCYLALNPKSTHKFIVGAFADLLVSLMPLPES